MESDKVEWKGWKNEIKKIVKENNNCMEKDELIKVVKGRYEEIVGDEEVNDEFVMEKISKAKRAKERCYIVI